MDDIRQLADFADEIWVHAGRLAVAILCGSVLGVERERKDKPAGLRTIVLISMGSALFMILSNLVPYAYPWPEATQVDPSRIAEGVVTGIGFLGAGTIIQARGSVQGLTTAAVIWVAAGIGMAAGMGYLAMALLFTATVLIVLLAMEPVRRRLSHLGHRYQMNVIAPNDSLVLSRIKYLLYGHDVTDSEIQVTKVNDREFSVDFVYFGYGGAAQRLLEALARIDGVHGRSVSEAPASP